MIQAFARLVIHEGIQRQLDFNRRFMEGLHRCIEAIDTTPTFEAFETALSGIIECVRQNDTVCAAALEQYVNALIKSANDQDADFETWTA